LSTTDTHLQHFIFSGSTEVNSYKKKFCHLWLRRMCASGPNPTPWTRGSFKFNLLMPNRSVFHVILEPLKLLVLYRSEWILHS